MNQIKTTKPLSLIKATAAIFTIASMTSSHAQNGDWCYLSMGSLNFGTLNEESSATLPGRRGSSSSGYDEAGNLLVFGGFIYNHGYSNSLFRYRPATQQWTWLSGSNTPDELENYGTLGVADSANHPGARTDALSWTDHSGNFWIYGGYCYSSPTNGGLLGDLWKYNLQTSQWTWVGGTQLRRQAPRYGEIGVADPQNHPGCRDQSAGWLDSQENVWIYGGTVSVSTTQSATLDDLWRFDGTNWTWMKGSKKNNQAPIFGSKGVEGPLYTPGSISQAKTWTDLLGNLWLFSWGNATVWKYNIATGNWAWMAGNNPNAGQSPVWGTKGVSSSSNTPGSRVDFASWSDAYSNFWLYGGTNVYDYDDLWKFDITSRQWTWMDGINQPSNRPVFGTKGIPAPDNSPGPVEAPLTWRDNTSSLWMYTGSALWKYTFHQSGIDWNIIHSMEP